MINLQRPPMLAALLSALALSVAAPAQAQRSAPAALALAPAGAEDPVLAQAFDAALQAYERCHWTAAFEQLLGLAEREHVPAARMALQMHQHGSALFGQALALSPMQLARLARMQVPTQVARVEPAP
ncbi:MAG: hypothetical protein Q8K45_20200 [Rubrivivax sp.]|nr:hypothetical protein [Rubrivivax sp.]